MGSGIPISLRIFHSLLWSTQPKVRHSQLKKRRYFTGTLLLFQWSNRCWQFDLSFSSSAFSKSTLNIWKFTVHILLKPGLENFEHYFASMWDECNFAVVWAFFVIAFLGIGMKTDLFQSCGHCWVFQICCHLTATLSKHHISGFEIAQLEFHHLH